MSISKHPDSGSVPTGIRCRPESREPGLACHRTQSSHPLARPTCCLLRFAATAAAAWVLSTISMAQEAASPDAGTNRGVGTIQGRVLNESSGSYLGNARVAVAGTSAETSTDATGFYRLTNVPAGTVEVVVTYVNFHPDSATVSVVPGTVAARDFQLRLETDARQAGKDVVQLDVLTVTEKQLSGRASALQEQKNAPNIKNVVSFDEFGEMGEGNVAEYLKFTPGLDISYSPNVPLYMSIRGMPSSGTVVTTDGSTMASTQPVTSRNFDFSLTATANIDRVEITKTPTPDLPANAVGGAINIITKSGFSQARPSLKYNAYLTHDQTDPMWDPHFHFGESAGPDSITTHRKILPSGNFSYINPVSEKLAFTLSGSYASRLMDWVYPAPTWDRVKLIQTADQVSNTRVYRKIGALSGSVDWRPTPNSLLTLSAQKDYQGSEVRTSNFTVTLGAGTTGGPEFSQGASTGVGTVNRAYTDNTQDKYSDGFALRYKIDGDDWKLDAGVAYSKGRFDSQPFGRYFTSVTTTNSINGNLILRMEGLSAINDARNPVFTATNKTGQPVDIFQADTLSITSVRYFHNKRRNEVPSANINLSRQFDVGVPVTIKVGAQIDQQRWRMRQDEQVFTFNPPNGAAGRLVTNYDVIADGYSNRPINIDANGNMQPIEHLDSSKVYKLYQDNPGWFTRNEVQRYTTGVLQMLDLDETITAGYVRADTRLLNNRLWLVGGFRYEHTQDKGAGPKNDISAIYQKNPDGSLAHTSGGALIPITNDALERAKLQYTAFGTHVKTNYDGIYPSLNSSYEINKHVVARAAYARTIGRPELTEMIPGVTVAEPADTNLNRTIAVNNTALKPWTANNYDLTLEAYDWKGMTASVSYFYKQVDDFFAATSTAATRPAVEALGITWQDFYDTYDIVTQRNAGSANLDGFELSFRQSLTFLPKWGKRIQVYANYTKMSVSGENADEFSFSPERSNWGIGYYGRKFSFNLNGAEGKPIRTGSNAQNATTPANTYSYTQVYPRYDVSIEYNFTRRFGIYASVRNLKGQPQKRLIYNPDTPAYAHPQTYQYAGSLLSFGVKGEW